MEATAQIGWFINDLERVGAGLSNVWMGREGGGVALGLYGMMASVLRRAFRKEDWVRLLGAAEVPREAATVEHWRQGGCAWTVEVRHPFL